MFKTYLIDLDHTLFDFNRAEEEALKEAFLRFEVPHSEHTRSRYLAINKSYWERFERSEVKKEDLLVGRFSDLLCELGLDLDARSLNEYYLLKLSEKPYLIPHAKELLEGLKGHFIVIASNGAKETQQRKLDSSGLSSFVDAVVLDEDAGFQKPDSRFFEYIIKKFKLEPEETLMVGDNPKVDIPGAKALGIKTCLFDPEERYSAVADYHVKNLLEILKL
ncbi:YjjG family noncanonical pyrimidine nucleotidase [Guggenheimella bovis]